MPTDYPIETPDQSLKKNKLSKEQKKRKEKSKENFAEK